MEYKFKAFVAPIVLLLIYWFSLVFAGNSALNTGCGITDCFRSKIPLFKMPQIISDFAAIFSLKVPLVLFLLIILGLVLGIRTAIINRKLRKTADIKYLKKLDNSILAVTVNYKIALIVTVIFSLIFILGGLTKDNPKSNCRPNTIITGYHLDGKPIYFDCSSL